MVVWHLSWKLYLISDILEPRGHGYGAKFRVYHNILKNFSLLNNVKFPIAIGVKCFFLIPQMWNICEMFNDKELKKAVMNFVDCHLEELIQDNLLEFLGFDEVQEILTRPKLCVWSHKFVCDSILKWILQKQSPAELIDVDELNMLAQLISTLRKTFSNMSDLYFDDPTFNDLIPKSSLSSKSNKSTCAKVSSLY